MEQKYAFKKKTFFRKRGWTIFKIGKISLSIGRILLLYRLENLTVTNTTNTYIRGWMQMVYCYMIYSPETKQIRQWDIWIRCHGTLLLFTYKMVTIHRNYIVYAWWVLFVTPDSSSRLPCCSMAVLPPPLLVINCLSCFPPGWLGPPPFPPPGLTPFPSGSRHLSPFFVRYTYYDLEQRLTYTSYSVIIKTYRRTMSTTLDLHVKSLVCCTVYLKVILLGVGYTTKSVSNSKILPLWSHRQNFLQVNRS